MSMCIRDKMTIFGFFWVDGLARRGFGERIFRFRTFGLQESLRESNLSIIFHQTREPYV